MASRPGYSDAWNAWRTLKHALPADTPGRRTLDAFFEQALDLRAMPPNKAQVSTQEINCASKAQVSTPKFNCPDPLIWGGDQYNCPKCGRIWDFNDERPNCTEGY